MSFRIYERLPATEYARRYSNTHERLRAEIGSAFANDDRKPIKSNNHNLMLVAVFAAGGVFWAILLWATMH